LAKGTDHHYIIAVWRQIGQADLFIIIAHVVPACQQHLFAIVNGQIIIAARFNAVELNGDIARLGQFKVDQVKIIFIGAKAGRNGLVKSNFGSPLEIVVAQVGGGQGVTRWES